VDRVALRDELARQDAAAAQALAEVDRLTERCAALAEREAATRRLLAAFPRNERVRNAELEAARDDAVLARREVEQASAELVDAERAGDDARLASAQRTRDHALATQHVAEQHEARLRDRATELVASAADARRQRDTMVEQAHALAEELHRLPRVSAHADFELAGPDELADWASSVRAALLVARSGLAAERDALLRQAAELASVSAEP
jgi:hypothetical protein